MKKILFILLFILIMVVNASGSGNVEIFDGKIVILSPDALLEMQMYRDGADAYIDWTTGTLYMEGGDIAFDNQSRGNSKFFWDDVNSTLIVYIVDSNQLDTNDINSVTGTFTGLVTIDTLNLDNPLTVPYGGTGATTLTNGGIILGSGVGAVTVLGVASNGQIPIGDGSTDPQLATITAGTGIAITNAAGSITIDVNAGAGGVIDHNSLLGLQGGTTDEYYHFTSSEHTELNAWLDDVTLGSNGKTTIPELQVDSININGDTISYAGGDMTLSSGDDLSILHGSGNVHIGKESDTAVVIEDTNIVIIRTITFDDTFANPTIDLGGSTIVSTNSEDLTITVDNNVLVATTNDVTVTAGGDLQLTAASGEIGVNANVINIAGTGVVTLSSYGTVDVLPSFDIDDYIRFQTADHVPEITTVGGCDLKITANSGTINFDNEILKTTGNLTDGTNSLSVAEANDAWTERGSQIAGSNLTWDGSELDVNEANSVNWDAAYTHSQDNTQAHTDYLINNGDDSTSGWLTSESGFKAADGTAAAPSYTFTTDLDTGMYSDAANTIRFSLGGINALTLLGNVFTSYYYSNTAFLGPTFNFQRAKGTQAIPLAVTTDCALLTIGGYGYTGSAYVAGGQIKMFAESNWGVGDCPARMSFWTVPDGSSTTAERMRIDNAGNVRIGVGAPEAKLQVVGNCMFGDDTNDLLISDAGVITMAGDTKRVLTLRPDLDFSTITAQGKPTRITYGAYQGYSLPIYAADEELFFNTNVPGRWDGASDITLDILVCLSQIEDVNDDFNLQLSWTNSELGEPILNTTTDVTVETNLLAGRVAAYDTYEVQFTIDYDADAGNHIVSHDDLALRIRRLAVAGTEITGEVIVLDYHLHLTVDKMFKAPE